MNQEHMTVQQAARFLRARVRTLLRAVRRGDIVVAGYFPGGYPRFRRSDVEKLAARLRSARRHSPVITRSVRSIRRPRSRYPGHKTRRRITAPGANSESFQLLFAGNPQPMWIYDLETLAFLEVNEAAVHYYGYTRDEFLDMRITDIRPAAEAARLLDEVRHLRPALQFSGEWQHRCKDGQIIDVEITSHTIMFAGRRAALVNARDITDRKRAEEALRHLSLHDTLTGLPNRALLQDRLEQAIAGGARAHQPVALLLLDLDRFKEVNNTLGHQHGDALLQQIGARLRSVLRTTDTVARLGGDEFAIILPGDDMTEAVALVERIRSALELPVDVEGLAISVDVSIGVTVYPTLATDATTLLRQADVAMYMAKRHGEPYAVYTPAQDTYTPERLSLVGELRQAITSGGLELYYQPQVHLATGHVLGVEALVRWPHPQRGLVLPNDFIPLAESAGLTGALTRWVVARAIGQCQRWKAQGLALSMAVNVSGANLRDPELPAIVSTLLQRADVAPVRLCIEVTEGSLIADTAATHTVLALLRELGVRLSVDDYGTGYSNLAYLKRLNIDELKIDRSFVHSMVQDGSDAAIVYSTVNLSHSLGLQAVAEGVEDAATWDALREMGCDVAQGYYLSPPLPATSLQDWARERPAARLVRRHGE